MAASITWRRLPEPALLVEAPADEPRLRRALLERAIGVIYRAETERLSHYFHARAADQFDALIHFDVTRALEPLDASPTWTADEPADIDPSGL
jgi:erythromycin esterase-like protein